MESRSVTKPEYHAHIAAWPRWLDRDVTAICEPPMEGYYDFTIAKGLDALVAKHFMDTGQYFICQEIP